MVTETHAFEIGRLYFTVFFHDEQLRLPEIETLVYLGQRPSRDGDCHWFQTAKSFSDDGFWNLLSPVELERLPADAVRLFPLDAIDPICDFKNLVAELEEWRERGNERVAT